MNVTKMIKQMDKEMESCIQFELYGKRFEIENGVVVGVNKGGRPPIEPDQQRIPLWGGSQELSDVQRENRVALLETFYHSIAGIDGLECTPFSDGYNSLVGCNESESETYGTARIAGEKIRGKR